MYGPTVELPFRHFCVHHGLEETGPKSVKGSFGALVGSDKLTSEPVRDFKPIEVPHFSLPTLAEARDVDFNSDQKYAVDWAHVIMTGQQAVKEPSQLSCLLMY